MHCKKVKRKLSNSLTSLLKRLMIRPQVFSSKKVMLVPRHCLTILVCMLALIERKILLLINLPIELLKIATIISTASITKNCLSS